MSFLDDFVGPDNEGKFDEAISILNQAKKRLHQKSDIQLRVNNILLNYYRESKAMNYPNITISQETAQTILNLLLKVNPNATTNDVDGAKFRDLTIEVVKQIN